MNVDLSKQEIETLLRAVLLAVKRNDTTDELAEFYVYMKNKFIEVFKLEESKEQKNLKDKKDSK